MLGRKLGLESAVSRVYVSFSELADDICCLLKEPCALRRAGSLPGKPIPPPVIVQRTPLNWKELDR